jgi:hypothetical protein
MGFAMACAMAKRHQGAFPRETVRMCRSNFLNALADLLAAVSNMAWLTRKRVAEMDINPVLVRPVGKGVVAADALVVLK